MKGWYTYSEVEIYIRKHKEVWFLNANVLQCPLVLQAWLLASGNTRKVVELLRNGRKQWTRSLQSTVGDMESLTHSLCSPRGGQVSFTMAMALMCLPSQRYDSRRPVDT